MALSVAAATAAAVLSPASVASVQLGGRRAVRAAARARGPRGVLQSWDPTLVNPCTWFHVTCNRDGRVDLGDSNLSGHIVPELGHLEHLQYLAASAAGLAMTRRVHPLISLNPYQSNWVIKVRVTSKGNLRTYKNARGEGCVFNVELTDLDGTQIQATMFNEAAKKFYPMFELGKVYYISKGSLKIASKQFTTVQNVYELTLNEGACVEEAEGETFIPQVHYNFVKINQLDSYVNDKELVESSTKIIFRALSHLCLGI